MVQPTPDVNMSAQLQSEQSPGASGSLKRPHEGSAEDVKVKTSTSPAVLVICIDLYFGVIIYAG